MRGALRVCLIKVDGKSNRQILCARRHIAMIGSFADAETERIWYGENSRRLPPDIQPTARRKLRQLNRISRPSDLREPRGNRFEALKGNRKETYSLRINDQWRITFRWQDGGADDVRIEDYH